MGGELFPAAAACLARGAEVMVHRDRPREKTTIEWLEVTGVGQQHFAAVSQSLR